MFSGVNMDGADPESLIKAIEARPGIWDTFCPDYHDRHKTRAAWEEIAEQFYPEFPRLSESEKNSIVMLVQRKWRNMRDSYVKDLRQWLSKSKSAKRRKYIFFDRLSFLRRSVESKMSRSSLYVKKEDGSDNSQSDEDATANVADVDIIDPKALIAVVENTPSIWDAGCPDYYDRVLTKEAWLNVCRAFYPHYDDLQESDRINLLGSVQKKWRHFRDCFVKDWKASNETTARGSRLRRRRHMYYDSLTFLEKSLEWKMKNNPHSSVLEDSIDEMSQDYDAFDNSEIMHEEEYQDPPEFCEVEKKFNPLEQQQMTQREVDQTFYPICSISNSPQNDNRPQEQPPAHAAAEQSKSKEITKEVTMFPISKETSIQLRRASQAKTEASTSIGHPSNSPEPSPPVELKDFKKATKEMMEKPIFADEDLAFFYSLLPTVKKFDEDRKLVFRVEVIKVIQKMKEDMKARSSTESNLGS